MFLLLKSSIDFFFKFFDFLEVLAVFVTVNFVSRIFLFPQIVFFYKEKVPLHFVSGANIGHIPVTVFVIVNTTADILVTLFRMADTIFAVVAFSRT